LADDRALAEASVQNAIADALAVLEDRGTPDPFAIENLMAATAVGEVERLRPALDLGDGPVPPRGRAPGGQMWPAIHALEPELQAERDVYAGRYVEAEAAIRIGLVDRVSATVGVAPERVPSAVAPAALHLQVP
jgi:hypothetical protein